MANQIVGYYTSQSETLLKGFDKTLALMNDTLVSQFGEEYTCDLQAKVRKEFEALIPDIPFISGGRAKMLNAFLLITAQELAAYLALSKLGKSPEEAWELCHIALRLSVESIPRWKLWLMRKLMFSKFVRRIVESRARRQEKGHFGGFEIEYLDGKGDGFDLGVNYLRCANLDFALKHGGEAFAPYICLSDIALSDAMGWGLTRTQTLADGFGHCDFRMKEGVATQISSKTPGVQKTIDKIRDQEAGPSS